VECDVAEAGRGRRQGTAKSVWDASRAAPRTTNVRLESTDCFPTTAMISQTKYPKSCAEGGIIVRVGAREVVMMRTTLGTDSVPRHYLAKWSLI
jgi:hypothetical protein